MKKSLLILPILPAMLLGSCSINQMDQSPIAIDYGYINNSTLTINQLEIGYSDVTNMVDRKESFVLLIFHDRNCGCWTNFNPIAIQFMKNYNLRFFAFDNGLLEDKKNDYGIYRGTEAMPGICFFRRGKLIRQVIFEKTKKQQRKIFTNYETLAQFMVQNIYLPKMYYVDKTTLDAKITGGDEFNILFSQETCGDCKMITKEVLYKWSESVKKQPVIENNKFVFDVLYVFDTQPYVNNGTIQDIRDEYYLSNVNNIDLGFGRGYVPTFQRRLGMTVLDMITVLNDQLGENDTLVSFFSEDRVAASPILKNHTKWIVDGKQLTKDEIGSYIDPSTEIEYRYVNKDAQLKWHKPATELFLSTYVK